MLKLNGRIGFGIEAFDYLSGSLNRCGIYSMELYVDSLKYCSLKMDKFSFNDSRFVNSLIDYEEKQKSNKNIQKAFIDPNNQLNFYDSSINSGIVEFLDDEIHNITFILKDAYLNTTKFTFQVQGQSQNQISNRNVNDDFLQLMSWETVNIFERDDIKLIIPEKALYNNLKFTYTKSEIPEGFYSVVHHIHNIYTPLHRPAELNIKPVGLPDSLQDKAVIVTLNRDGKWLYSDSDWAEGTVKTGILQFGQFSITVDTIPPQITPLNLNETLDLKGKTSLRFRIKDDLSGIQSYEGYIDNKWVLFEYDAKNNIVYHEFDAERITMEKNHELELYIVDNKDNISFYYTEFYW